MFTKIQILKYNLWPAFSIESHKTLLEQLENLPADKYPEIVIKLELMNLFLMRRTADPGFFRYILDRISEDITPLKKAKKYIEKIFSTNIAGIDTQLFKLPESEKKDKTSQIEIEPTSTLPFDSPILRNLKALQINQDALIYFNMRLNQAIERNDFHEINAIQSSIYEYTTGKYIGYWLFGSSSPYEGTSDVERWKYMGRQFITKNIKYEALYYLSSREGERLFHSYTWSKKIDDYVKEHIINEIQEEYKSDHEQNLSIENKFHNDIISIASWIWFQEKTEKEQVEMLNTDYHFSIDDNFLEQMAKDDLNYLYFFSHHLYQAGYVVESLKVNIFHLAKCNNEICRSSCNDNIATSYRELGDYQKALESFLKALKIMENLNAAEYSKIPKKTENEDANHSANREYRGTEINFENPEMKEYRIAIEQKNLAEIYFYLKNYELSKIYYKKVVNSLSQFSKKDQAAILLNLARSHRRIYDFEEEYKYLSELLNYNTLPDASNQYISQRLNQLNQKMDLSAGGKLNRKTLINDEIQERVTDIRDRAVKLTRSFQFDRAISEYIKAIQLNWDAEIITNIGVTYLKMGQFNSARECFKELLQKNPKDITGNFYLGVLEIIEGNIESSISDLIKSMRRVSQFEKGPEHLLQEFLVYLLNNNQSDKIILVIDKIIEHPDFTLEKSQFYGDIALELTELGFHDEAISFFEKARNHTKSNQARAKIINNLGTNFADRNLHASAIEYYQEAIKLYAEDHAFWLNMASSYSYEQNFLRAIEALDEALKYAPGKLKPFIEETRAEYEEYNKEVLNLNVITDVEIKQMLLSAEHLIQHTKDYKVPLDFSFFIVEYAKPLEKLLDIKITAAFKRRLQQRYPKGLPSNYLRGDDQIPKLPPYLQKVMRRKETIPLGTWILLIDRLQVKYHPVEDELKNCIANAFTPDKINIIREACGLLRSYRGGAAHSDVRSRQDVLDIRSEIIPHLNKIINLFYL